MGPRLITMMALEVPSVMTMTAALAYFEVAPGGWVRDDDLRGAAGDPGVGLYDGTSAVRWWRL